MFTGIIQKVAVVKEIRPISKDSLILVLSNPYAVANDPDPIAVGESIATNGVCLTAVPSRASHSTATGSRLNETDLQFDVSPATLAVTGLGRLKVGSKVNLERSLRMGDRLSGHWVQGHVDGTAVVKKVLEVGKGFYELTIAFTEQHRALARYCVSKGSISIDGTSLTIQAIEQNSLKFQIIPHTWAETSLSDLRDGDLVNIEVDILAKYIERFNEYDQNTVSR